MLTVDEEYKLSFLELVNESNYEVKKQQASATVPDYFTGNWDEFKEMRRARFELMHREINVSRSSAYYRSFVSTAQLAAFLECCRTNEVGIACCVENQTEFGCQIRVTYFPEGGNGQMSDPTLVVPAEHLVSIGAFAANPFSGEAIIQLRRTSGNQVISGNVFGRVAGGGMVSDEFLVPVYRPPIIIQPPPPKPAPDVNETIWPGGTNELSLTMPAKPYRREVRLIASQTSTIEAGGPRFRLDVYQDGAPMNPRNITNDVILATEFGAPNNVSTLGYEAKPFILEAGKTTTFRAVATNWAMVLSGMQLKATGTPL
ncbi:hypothetical protein ABT392_00455 [Paucibacter sp. JuS9]|uniref:hypothetical protein n=1 Tax=Paucibacter sp. JuS9 TaxID=3228748 RepID=UPI003757520D